MFSGMKYGAELREPYKFFVRLSTRARPRGCALSKIPEPELSVIVEG